MILPPAVFLIFVLYVPGTFYFQFFNSNFSRSFLNNENSSKLWPVHSSPDFRFSFCIAAAALLLLLLLLSGACDMLPPLLLLLLLLLVLLLLGAAADTAL